MDGQAGEDTILLSGNSSEYSIDHKSNIRYRYTYNSSQNMKTGSFYFLSGPDGSADFFRNIERLQFDDRRVTPEQLLSPSYSSFSADRTRNYHIKVYGKNHGIHMAGDDNNQDIRSIPPSTMITVHYTYYDTYASDRLLGSEGANGESCAHDYFSSLDGDDFIGGGGGRDVINPGLGDDELRGGLWA